MNADASEKNWQESELADQGPRGLLTELAESLSYLSSESRAERKKQKLRADLVREYIEDDKQSPSLLQAVVGKLVNPS